MERFDLNIWSHLLLSCATESDYLNALLLIPHSRYRHYFLHDRQARQKRIARYTVHEVSSSGVQRWLYRGLRHREGDLPALVFPDGSRYWFLRDYLQRLSCKRVDGSFYDVDWRDAIRRGVALSPEFQLASQLW